MSNPYATPHIVKRIGKFIQDAVDCGKEDIGILLTVIYSVEYSMKVLKSLDQDGIDEYDNHFGANTHSRHLKWLTKEHIMNELKR